MTTTTQIVTSAVRAYNVPALRRVVGRLGSFAPLICHTTVGDGRGAMYTWDPYSTRDDDDWQTIAPTGLTRGRWRLIASELDRAVDIIDIRAFGASTATGAGNYDAIWAAIEAAAFYSSNRRTSKIKTPNGTFNVEGEIEYVGIGEAFSLIGEQGGQLNGGSKWKWVGDAGGTMLTLAGVWRGVIEHLDLFGNYTARRLLFCRSNQVNDGAGFQGYRISNCGFYGVDGTLEDPVLVEMGEENEGTTAQVDTSSFDDCMLFGDDRNTNGNNVTGWRQGQGGNTCCFSFLRCQVGFCRFGIDATKNSNWLSLTDVEFGQIGSPTPLVSASAACVVVGVGGAQILIQGGGAQSILPCRYVHCVGVAGTACAGMSIRGVETFTAPTADNVLINFAGQLTLDSNTHKGVGEPYADPVFKVVSGTATIIGKDIPIGTPPGSVISRNCNYGKLPVGSWAPFYDGQDNPLTGPDSYGPGGYYGYQRCAVSSIGDMATDGATSGSEHTVGLEPWDGSVAHDYAAWTPGVIADGASVLLTDSWAIAGVLPWCNDVDATWSTYLPAGVVLTAGKSGAEAMWAMITNRSGSQQTIAAGTVTWHARRVG